jgi:hypothetical protein
LYGKVSVKHHAIEENGYLRVLTSALDGGERLWFDASVDLSPGNYNREAKLDPGPIWTMRRQKNKPLT